MTGGQVIILGDVGKNFGAGMSGGIAYVLPKDREAFKSLCNLEMIELEDIDDQTDGAILWERILNHFIYTGSTKAGYVLENWEKMAGNL